MKFLKWALVAFGAVGMLVAGWFLFQSWVGIGKMMAVAVSNRSAEFPSPMNHVYLAAGLGVLGGFLLGLGVGLPRRTAHSILRDAADATTAKPQRAAEVPEERPEDQA